MAWKIEISRSKPNPIGKDKNQNKPRAEQLLGEFVDLKNVGNEAVNVSVLGVGHRRFSSSCVAEEKPSLYWDGGQDSSVIVQPGQLMRLHTGNRNDRRSMLEQDAFGTQHHGFADSGNFVLNNLCGDEIFIWRKENGQWQFVDKAIYDRNPPEGVILVRKGDKLVRA